MPVQAIAWDLSVCRYWSGRSTLVSGSNDNALAESVNAAVKVELVNRTVYPTRKKAKEAIARYIELRYNRTRLHSGLGYRTPQEVLDEYLNQQAAA
jgi:transposase InsO family protein